MSGGEDRLAVMWDTTTWQEVAELRGSMAEVQAVTFSADGQHLVVAAADGLARVYPREMFAPLDELLGLLPRRIMRQPQQLTVDESTRFAVPDAQR